jgi:hypothetical protein
MRGMFTAKLLVLASTNSAAQYSVGIAYIAIAAYDARRQIVPLLLWGR